MLDTLTWRAMTESLEEGDNDSQHSAADMRDDELSDDELLHDTPQPARQAAPARPARSACPIKPSKPARITQPISKEALQHIDWVFWIPIGDIGLWRPLSDLPNSIRASFVQKFESNYLQKPKHIERYVCMLRNRKARLHHDRCINNIIYENRSKDNRRKNAKGDKERNCDLCSNHGRFCARVVRIGPDVKLGFFPLPEGMRGEETWTELRYWVRETTAGTGEKNK